MLYIKLWVVWSLFAFHYCLQLKAKLSDVESSDSKVDGAIMGPTRVLLPPGPGPQ